MTGVKSDGVHLDIDPILEPISAFIPAQPVIEEKQDEDTVDSSLSRIEWEKSICS